MESSSEQTLESSALGVVLGFDECPPSEQTGILLHSLHQESQHSLHQDLQESQEAFHLSSQPDQNVSQQQKDFEQYVQTCPHDHDGADGQYHGLSSEQLPASFIQSLCASNERSIDLQYGSDGQQQCCSTSLQQQESHESSLIFESPDSNSWNQGCWPQTTELHNEPRSEMELLNQSVFSAENIKKQKNILGMKAAMKRGFFSGAEGLALSRNEYEKTEGNYLRGCKWSPDGRVLLTNSEDNYMRLYHVPLTILTEQKKLDTELTCTLPVHESELVYDYCFYPRWKTEDDSTCLFVTACRDLPIHMHSAISGTIVQSYRCYDHVDEITAPHSIGFTSDGKYLLAGFKQTIRCFATDQPGRDCVVASTVVKCKDQRGRLAVVGGQRGILSCFAAHPTTPYLMAAGDFSGNVAIYDVSRSCSFTIGFEGQFGGITHMVFSEDGNYLYTGGRKDPEINCFDIRNPEKVLYVMYRYVATNQRMYFDLDWSNRYLLSGNHNGNVSIWDLHATPVQDQLLPWPILEPVATFEAHADSCNGCSVNPKYPLLATSSGQRHYDIDLLMEDEESQSTDDISEEDSLKIWNLKLP